MTVALTSLTGVLTRGGDQDRRTEERPMRTQGAAAVYKPRERPLDKPAC